ncbi:hypothetical protein [Vibrio sp. ABG19]|uniref:hypothetical protein n=1 Tax=Vibrio sp. ABG19 TaxID=2817385 RepID=UPI00249DC67B|nr:hypothetical protein [Vibrio sp. ABG19]WGY48426.1 hypothetical protein J0X00_12695 [Vibrio sp. ABG19]
MKYKLLTTCVAVALLAGCGSDNDNDATTGVQAYDGAIRGISGSYTCEDGTSGAIPATGSDGFAYVSGATAVESPNTCSFTFNPTAGAVDMSNGKDMSAVELSIPRGLAEGSRVQATPFTTLVSRKMEETGATTYDESTAIEVLNDLGLGDLTNQGVTISQIMTDLDSVITQVKQSNPALGAQLVATTHILSDVLTTNVTDTTQISNASQNLAKKTVAANPNYPTSQSGGDVVVDVKDYDMSSVTDEVLDDTAIDNLEDVPEQEAEPVDETPTGGGGTGGTGGTGSTGGAGGTSGA